VEGKDPEPREEGIMGSWPEEELLRRFLPLLREQAKKRKIPPEDIDDVIHAALLRSRVREDCPPLDPDEARPWLLAIFEFGRLTYVNKLRRSRVELCEEPDELFAVAEDVDAEGSIEGWDLVLRALRALPSELREAFWEHVFEGATVAETAERLGITKRMAKRRIADAKRQLERAVERLDSTARSRFALVWLLLFADTFRALRAPAFAPAHAARAAPAPRPRSPGHPRSALCGALVLGVAAFLGSDTLAQTSNEAPAPRAVVALEGETITRVAPAPVGSGRCVEPPVARPATRGRAGWQDASRVFEARALEARGEDEEALRLLEEDSRARRGEEGRHAP
jgi:RNA polymerase sigma factor (sigma-70 family)